MTNPISPDHYKWHPSGIECIDVTERFPFCTGNAIKYLWRCGHKEGVDATEDLKKAKWYIDRQISLLAKASVVPPGGDEHVPSAQVRIAGGQSL